MGQKTLNMKSTSEQLEDLQIDLGLLRNRVLECHVTIHILTEIIIGMKVEYTGMDRETIKSVISTQIQDALNKIQGKSG